ncbi:MAG: preprotein translocase subunit SecA, partial [Flavobacteriales bacterium]|nr:preprotein translocase subunit SecA [Flavobacteriales bacterium]
MSIFTSFTKIFGNKYKKDIKKITPIIEKIHQEFDSLQDISNDELRNKTKEFILQIQDSYKEEQEKIKELKLEIERIKDIVKQRDLYGKIEKIELEIKDKRENKLNEILPQAFAVVKETCKRFSDNKLEVSATDFDKNLATKKDNVQIKGEKAVYDNTWIVAGSETKWNMVHYDVQLIGGVVLHQGKIAEMQTGEGKTLSATLPAYLNALTKKGVHIVTVNDYLAKRDAEWMAPVFEFHNLSVDCIDHYTPNSDERKKAYNADITYGTNNEFGFDYLRDNMAIKKQDLVQRPHSFGVVDEVDSVLIDDARTPLIISGPVKSNDKTLFTNLKPVIEKLVLAQKTYVSTVLQDAKKLIQENEKDAGFNLLRAYRGLPKNKSLIKFLSEEGVKIILQKTENFYLQEKGKNMPLVDKELFFTIDEKNNSIELTDKGIELISKNNDDSNFFILPDVGLEIAKIEKSEENEKTKETQKEKLLNDFSIKSERIHAINQLLKAHTLFEKDVEYVVMDNKVKIVDEQTGRIMEGRRYSDGLHQAIEAKENVKIESATQTLATITLQNYFRMYDKLSGMTGTAETEAEEFWEIYKLECISIPTNVPVVRKDKEDLVYKTKKDKYKAIIEEIQKLKKEGRPVLVGTTSVEVSELLSKMLTMQSIKHNVLNAKRHQQEADIVAQAGYKSSITIATNMAGRGTDIKLSDEVKSSGGLAILGTERHDSRRVDRQLRGRAGRQGDPGSSQFYVCLEDNLMRLFGSERIAKVMDRLGLKEGEVIQHSMVTKSIERAQRKVEENNFGIRKRLLEYDDVMNAQREHIYKKRKNALFGEEMEIELDNLLYSSTENIVNENLSSSNYENFKLDCIRHLATQTNISEEDFLKNEAQKSTEKTLESVKKNYEIKSEIISKQVFPLIKNVFENESEKYKNIIVPFFDGKKTIQVVASLEDVYNSNGINMIKYIETNVFLSFIDLFWKEHLRALDDLRQSVQGAVYEQKDPLLIYKFESFELFKGMLNIINKEITSFLLKAKLPVANTKIEQQKNNIRENQNIQTSRQGFIQENQSPGGRPKREPLAPIKKEKKIN